jgi:hypothetical protein
MNRVKRRAALAGEVNALKAQRRDVSFQGAFLADESKDGALKISSREELENWLNSLPPEQGRWVAVAIAARAASRALPIVASARRDTRFENLTFAVFFAIALARVAADYPNAAHELPAGSAAVDAGKCASNIANDDYDARNAAYAAGNAAVTAANASDVSPPVYVTYTDELWSTVSRDANFIASGGTAEALAREPLWSGLEPDWSTKHWKLLQDALPRENDWQVWIDWYERRRQQLF